MHNCKATRNRLIELVMNRTDQNQLPPAELESCPACREEFAWLRNALRATEASICLAQPAESFWSGYNERLRERLEREPRSSNGWLPPPPPRFNLPLWLRRALTTSVPVPVPVTPAPSRVSERTVDPRMSSPQTHVDYWLNDPHPNPTSRQHAK